MTFPGSKPYTFDRVVRILFSIAALIGVFWLLETLRGALLPFLVAWLLAYLIHPLVQVFQQRLRIRSGMLAIVCALVAIVLFFSVVGYFVLPSVVAEFEKLRQIVGEFLQSRNRTAFLPGMIDRFIRENIDFDHLAVQFESREWMAFAEDLLSRIWTLVSGSVNQIISIVSWFIVLLYLVFILHDYDKIIASFKAMIPATYRPVVLNILNDVEVSMNRYFRGQSLVAFLVGVLFSVGFLIVGLPLAIPLGLFIGLLNMVPYLQIVGFVPTILLCLLDAYESGGNFWVVFAGSMGVFIVVQLIQDLFLVPRIMGKVTGLNPAIILLSLSVWGSLLGIVGMIVALPLTTLMLSYYQRYVLDRADAKVDAASREQEEAVPKED